MDQPTTQDPTQLLAWLDEQHREDRRQLAELRKLAEAQSMELEHLTKRFEELERGLAGTQAQLTKFSEIEEVIRALKSEIRGVVEDSETRLQRADGQLESRLEAQTPRLAALATSLEEVRSLLGTLENKVEAIPAHIDHQREQAAGLARDIEEIETRFNQMQARLTPLGEQLSQHADSMLALARQLESLEGRLTSTRAGLITFSQVETAIQQSRDDVILMFRQLEEVWKRETRESKQLRESELKALRVALDNLEKQLEPIPKLEDRLKGLPAEDRRLRDLITEQALEIPPLHKSIEELRERTSYLEEDRPRTSRRFDELEQQLPPLYEGIQENAGKVQFLEEWVQRSAQNIDAFQRFEDQMERWRAAFIEEIRQSEQHRNRRLTDWERILAEHAGLFDQWREILRRYEIAHQDNLRAVSSLQGLPERLERDRAELAEKQRLADERVQRELNAWQEENEKRWRLFLQKYDYDWEQHLKRDAEQDRRFEPLETWRDEHVNRVSEEFDRLDENDRRVLARLADIARYVDKALEYQISQQKKQLDLLHEEMRPSDFDVLVTPPREEIVARTNRRPTKSEA
jgi:chromosome segregation ATPase